MTEQGRSLDSVEYQKYVTVDGMEYKILSLPPTKAFKLGIRLTKLIGEPFASMAVAANDESKMSEVLPNAIKKLTANLDEDSVLQLIKDLISSVEYEKKPINFESHFQARLGHMLKLFGEVAQFQFKDFFEAIGQAVADVMSKAA